MRGVGGGSRFSADESEQIVQKGLGEDLGVVSLEMEGIGGEVVSV